MKKCKYCGTEDEAEFVRKSGKSGLTVCTKCMSKNRSGENNQMFGKIHNPKTRMKMSNSSKRKGKGLKYSTEYIELTKDFYLGLLK